MATQQSTVEYTQKILFTGTQAAIDAAEKSASGLYFASDTHKIFKGTEDYSQAARVVTAIPATPAKSSLYVVVDGSGNFVKAVAVNSAGVQTDISYAFVNSATGVSGTTPSDVKIPTEKAIVEYIDSIVGGDEVVTDVRQSTTAGTVTVQKGDGADDGEVYNVTIPGVALKPTYEATNRVITIPYTENGSDPAGSLIINLGKDMVVTAGRYNAATEEIWLWLTGSDPQTDPADIVIPVGDLIDELEVEDTDTVDMTYTAATNTVKADVKVSGKTGNAIQVLTNQTSASENGLFVDLSAYALASDLADARTDINTVQTNVTNLEAALTTWTVLS